MSSNCSVKLTSQERGAFDVANFMVLVIGRMNLYSICAKNNLTDVLCIHVDLLYIHVLVW